MITEEQITIATNWWADRLKDNVKDVTEEQLQIFKQTLADSICEFEETVHYQIKVDYDPDENLLRALKACGVWTEGGPLAFTINDYLPTKTRMRFMNRTVMVKYGYGSSLIDINP